MHQLAGRHRPGGYRLGHLGKARAFDRSAGQCGKVVGDQWTRYHLYSAAVIVERSQGWYTAGSSGAGMRGGGGANSSGRGGQPPRARQAGLQTMTKRMGRQPHVDVEAFGPRGRPIPRSRRLLLPPHRPGQDRDKAGPSILHASRTAFSGRPRKFRQPGQWKLCHPRGSASLLHPSRPSVRRFARRLRRRRMGSQLISHMRRFLSARPADQRRAR
jgi:hypothetical protein